MHEGLDRGTHFGANHEQEVRWAALVKQLVPSAERVRFTSSGTEATHMALRLARAHTGRPKVIRFVGHFHGWHDHMTAGHSSHFDGSPTPGVLPGVTDGLVLLPQNDTDALRATLEANSDIAAAILEPTGSHFGGHPVRLEFLHALRELTAEHGVVLIFDEVITGFRVSPGGLQAYHDIIPDMTTLAKIVAGGLPGGAVVGQKPILDQLDFEVAAATDREKIEHQGTFNANPLSSSAGIAALEIIAETDACERASDFAGRLRDGTNALFESEGVPWALYGTFSSLHTFLNPNGADIRATTFDPFDHYESLGQKPPHLLHKLRLALQLNGVDLNGNADGLTSAVHDDDDLERTVAAFGEAITLLRREGEL